MGETICPSVASMNRSWCGCRAGTSGCRSVGSTGAKKKEEKKEEKEKKSGGNAEPRSYAFIMGTLPHAYDEPTGVA